MTRLFLRHPDAGLVSRRDRCVFVKSGAEPLVLEPRDATKMARAFQRLEAPLGHAELETYLELKDLLLLVAHGFVLQGEDPAALLAVRGAPTSPRQCRRLTLCVTGAVGAVNAPALGLALQRRFAERVDVVLTESACKMVVPDAFGYLGLETWTDAFARRGDVNVPHIALAGADVVVVAPASAHTIHEIAAGACSSLVSLVVAATRAPVVVAPSMNVAMWENAAIAANVALLRARGVHVVEPSVGIEAAEHAAPRWSFGGADLDPAYWCAILGAVLAEARAEVRP